MAAHFAKESGKPAEVAKILAATLVLSMRELFPAWGIASEIITEADLEQTRKDLEAVREEECLTPTPHNDCDDCNEHTSGDCSVCGATLILGNCPNCDNPAHF